MKVQIEIDLSDEEIEFLKKCTICYLATDENYLELKSLFMKGLLNADHTTHGSYYEVTMIGEMILEKLNVK